LKLKERISLKVWGPIALFTRPENKVERVSYDVMTASAARAMLEAVYWKPEIQYHVEAIEVLNPIKYLSVKRNEINKLMKKRQSHIDVNDPYNRTQRMSVFLKDVSYIIRASIEKIRSDEPMAKHVSIFKRRADKGQCKYQPYLGTRECIAYFDLPDGTEKPIQQSCDLGIMLQDMYYIGDGEAIPMFVPLKMEQGVVRIPERKINRAPYLAGGG
jgi:CRISPR-associated protein Cas5d